MNNTIKLILINQSNPILDAHHSHELGRVYSVDQIEIKARKNQFILIDRFQEFELQDNDQILVGNQNFKVLLNQLIRRKRLYDNHSFYEEIAENDYSIQDNDELNSLFENKKHCLSFLLKEENETEYEYD